VFVLNLVMQFVTIVSHIERLINLYTKRCSNFSKWKFELH